MENLTYLPPGNLWLNLALSSEPCEDMAFKRSTYGSVASVAVKVDWNDYHEDLGPAHSHRCMSPDTSTPGDEAEDLDTRVAFLTGVLGDVIDRLLVSGRGVKTSSFIVSYIDWLFARWADLPPPLSSRSFQAVAESRINAASLDSGNKSENKSKKELKEVRKKEDMLELMKSPSFYQGLSAVDLSERETIKSFLEQVLGQIIKLKEECEDVMEIHDAVVEYLLSKIHEKAEEEEKKMQGEIAPASSANSIGGSTSSEVKKGSSSSKLHKKLMRPKEKRMEQALAHTNTNTNTNTNTKVTSAAAAGKETGASSPIDNTPNRVKKQKKKKKTKESTKKENATLSHVDEDFLDEAFVDKASLESFAELTLN